jgi:hypothetical protein
MSIFFMNQNVICNMCVGDKTAPTPLALILPKIEFFLVPVNYSRWTTDMRNMNVVAKLVTYY